MAGSIADFKASFRTDLARPSRFDVNVPIPIGLLPYREIGRTLKMRCENAELPGRSISTTSMKIYGVEEKFPYQTTYNDTSLTFIVGDDMAEKKFFDAWLNWINPTINYNLKYKADYAVPLTVNQYDVKNELSYSVTMLDAFPIAVNQLDLDWSSDGHHKLTVTFAYTSWRNNSLEALGMELLETTIANSLFDSAIQRESLLGRDLIQAPFESRVDFESRQGFRFDQL
jgi:hypothetical protein